MKKILTEIEGNDYIYNKINEGQSFCVGRMGVVELNCMFWKISNKQMPPYLAGLLSNNAGVYSETIDNWYKIYSSAVSACDANVFWQDSANTVQCQVVLGALSPKSQKLSNRSVEPFYFENPWSKALKDKRVLVISPFPEDIESQYKNKDLIWKNNILPSFDIVTYESVQSIGAEGPHNSWSLSLKHMQKDISKIEFDIAILGCGSYGIPLCAYIKNTLGKSAIYIGGGLQILFGIKGKRWDNHEDIKNMYNEHWIRPSLKYKPFHANTVEGGCYW